METEGYKALFGIMAQIATNAGKKQANQGLVNRILKLCQRIIDNINESSRLEKAAEDRRIKSYLMYKAQLDQDIAQS